MVPFYWASIRKHLIGFQWAGAARLNKPPLQPFVRSSPAQQMAQVADPLFHCRSLKHCCAFTPLCPSFTLERERKPSFRRAWLKLSDMKSGNRVDTWTGQGSNSRERNYKCSGASHCSYKTPFKWRAFFVICCHHIRNSAYLRMAEMSGKQQICYILL